MIAISPRQCLPPVYETISPEQAATNMQIDLACSPRLYLASVEDIWEPACMLVGDMLHEGATPLSISHLGA